jgi:putative protease
MNELEKIREGTTLELEVFIHGALCYSFSGQCLFSSAIGGRSGNRGTCAQPCRKRYTLRKQKGYLLSTADLFGIELLPDLLRLGIDGVKIEGRMRSPLYVYLTSKIYTTALRRAKAGKRPLITPREKEVLEVIFNRGFSQGYLMENTVIQKAYAGSRGLFLGRGDCDGEKIAVKAGNLKEKDGVTLYQRGQKVGGFEITKVEKNKDMVLLYPPFKISKGKYLVYKTKDRDFDLLKRKITGVPFSSDFVEKKRRKLSRLPEKREETKGDLSVYLSSLKSLEKVIPYADRVYFEWNNYFQDAVKRCKQEGIECVLLLPRLSFDVPTTDAESVMISSIDHFEKYSNRKLYGHYAMNFFNSLTIPDLFQYTLSVELSKDDIEGITRHDSRRLEVMVFGRIELMVSRDPVLEEGTLVDGKRKRFPVYRDRFGVVHILNSSDLFLLDYLDDLEKMGINSFGIDLRRRDPTLSEIVTKATYERDQSKKPVITKKCKSITAQHYRRGVK